MREKHFPGTKPNGHLILKNPLARLGRNLLVAANGPHRTGTEKVTDLRGTCTPQNVLQIIYGCNRLVDIITVDQGPPYRTHFEYRQKWLRASCHKQNRMCWMSPPTTSPALKYTDLDGEHCFALAAESTSIGRSPDQDLVLKEAYVSRRHALITKQNGHFELVDQNSSHGTFLDRKSVV